MGLWWHITYARGLLQRDKPIMIKNNFYPLRTIIGSSISVNIMIPFPRVASPLNIVVRDHPDINDAVFDEIYSKYLPDIIQDGATYHPLPGMNTMPIPDSNLLPFDNIGPAEFLNIFRNPSDIPFPATDPVSSIYGYQEDSFIELQLNLQDQNGIEQINHFYSGRDKTYSFLILLDRKALVGGICFNGYPFISSRIEIPPEGMTVGNFGLPREMRLTPLPSFQDKKSKDKSIEELTGFQRSQFIDSEFAYTRQEIISHSGLNYLTIDPVKTNLFMLTLTDLPFIPKIINLDAKKGDPNNPLVIKGFKGFAIPYLYFFEYKEQTKRNARLHSGLLGVKPSYPHLPKVDGDPASEDILRRAFPEYEYYFLEEEKNKGNDKKIKSIEAELAKLKLLLGRNPGRNPRRNPQDKEKIKQRIKELNKELKKLKAEKQETQREGVYWLYTAHSASGQRREFEFSQANLNYSPETRLVSFRRRTPTLTECFVSDLLQPDEKITLYLQQGEEFERCVAGLKVLFLLVPSDDFSVNIAEQISKYFGIGSNDLQLTDEERTFIEDALAYVLSLPPETNFCEKIGLKVYEVDPVEGISPASVDLKSKYATLLVDITIDDFMDVIFSQMIKGIPFRKISSTKYLVMELTNKGEKNGQIAIHSLQMIRSAHVSVQPRAAKMQQVKAMHYRIIGPELADDFSKLGAEGFNFSIDRMVAGQTKNVLYAAMSLLDLLHTGGARIQSNARRRAVEFEMAENFLEKKDQQENYSVKKFEGDDFSGINFENRETDNDNTSWRSIESGKDVVWPFNKGRPDFVEFKSFSGSEIRSRTEQISSLIDPLAAGAGQLSLKLQEITGSLIPINNPLITINTASRLVFLDHGTMNSITPTVWEPFSRFFNLTNLPPIQGYQTLNIPPFYLYILDKLTELTNVVNMISSLGLDLANLNPLTNLTLAPGNLLTIQGTIIDDLLSKISIANGLSVGFNLGGNLGGSLPFIIPMPPPVPPIPGIISGGPSSGASISANSNLSTAMRTSTNGSMGSIVMSGQELKHSLNRSKQEGYDNNISHSEFNEAEHKRIITRRELLNRDKERVRGAEVMWQDKIQDIITGSIPLNFTLPATATKMNFRTADDALRVRFNSGFSPSIEVDFWFELTEETIKDDN
jgi:hypothetical protein